jgi:hypothetical protein
MLCIHQALRNAN